uniref:Uncharacterized protein n=1 Tax=Medicago truncatula TaxID=3880 RepID=A2Q5F3_MEDTR|nr:hypothetical protein MtrDRAFT_AC161399g3v2 [Medicago truncatula]
MSRPKTDVFMKTTTVKTIYNTTHRHYSPQRILLKIKLSVLNTKAEPHPKSSYSKDHSTSTTSRPPIHRKNTNKSPKPNLSQITYFRSRIKSDRPTRL